MINRPIIAISVVENISSSDGSTVRPLRLVDILKNHFKIILISKSKGKKRLKLFENVKYILVKPNSIWNLKLLQIIFKNNIDLVYCSNDFYGFFTYYFMSIFFNYKIIYESHSIISKELEEIGINKFKVGLFKILEKFVIKNAHHVIALSENSYNFYRKYNQKIDLVPVFVDENQFKNPKEIIKIKNERKMKKVGLIGPFDSVFNEYYLEFLYRNLDKFDERIKFIIMGSCDYKINDKKIEYTGYIEDLQDYIHILSGLDAVLIPSNKATHGPLNKIIEPMSCSVPVFTTPKGMVGLYYVRPGEDIFVFDEDLIIDKLNEILFDNCNMNKVSHNARKVVENYYGKEINRKKLITIFDKLLN